MRAAGNRLVDVRRKVGSIRTRRSTRQKLEWLSRVRRTRAILFESRLGAVIDQSASKHLPKDLAKQVFQVHGADVEGAPLFNRKLRRAEVLRFFAKLPPCLVGMEACASAHYWAREIAAIGHDVRLLPPQYVKPFVKRGKTDAADAEAIAEAVTRKTMRFVPVKTRQQQAAVMVLKTRALLVRQRTQAINALRSHMGELGIIAPTGIANVKSLAVIVRDEDDVRLPPAARFALTEIVEQIEMLAARIDKLTKQRQQPTDDAAVVELTKALGEQTQSCKYCKVCL